MAYRVFVRNWWRSTGNKTLGEHLVPDPGARKTTLVDRVDSEEEARRIAQEYNATHKPGRLSRKAEYESR